MIVALLGDAGDSREKLEQSQKLTQECRLNPVNEPAAAQTYPLSAVTFLNTIPAQGLAGSENTALQMVGADGKLEAHAPKHETAALRSDYRKQRLLCHCVLIKSMLAEIESKKYKIDHIIRSGMCRVLLDFHWNYWLPLRQIYGPDSLLEIMSQDHPKVVRNAFSSTLQPHRTVLTFSQAMYWVSQLENTERSLNLQERYTCNINGCGMGFQHRNLLQWHQELQ